MQQSKEDFYEKKEKMAGRKTDACPVYGSGVCLVRTEYRSGSGNVTG